MSESLEIEKKYIVSTLPDLVNENTLIISQGYISASDPEVRIRRANDDYFLTIKKGTGLVRQETEICISELQFSSLWPLTEGKRIEKQRHLIPWKSHTIELDVFSKSLSPLIIAEIEFPSIEASEAFMAPSWLGSEITHDPRYKNKNLATKGLPI